MPGENGLTYRCTMVQEGRQMAHVADGAIAAGEVVVVGSRVCIATVPIADGATGALAVRGVFKMPKETGSATALGAGLKVYWDASAAVVTTSADSHKQAGYTFAAASDDDEYVPVDLQPA